MPPPSPDPVESAAAGQWFRRGLGLRAEVQGQVAADHHSDLVRRVRAEGHQIAAGGTTVRLAREYGFCYGVERAVDYAYETVERFPDRRIVLTGEIIHNPGVNGRLRELGIRFLGDPDVADLASIGPDDVVVVPAFGVPAPTFEALRRTGCVVVDTTCGSVLNVWKNVERYAREGRTSVIHGKASHEETLATVSRARLTPGAHTLVLFDREEARLVAAWIRGGPGAPDREAMAARLDGRTSPGFDPARHLERIGMANQTTMLSGESLEIAEILRAAVAERHPGEVAERFASFDTICSATQDRQDALHALVEEPLDLILVVGGYNSSNTGHLLEIAKARRPAYHVDRAECLLSPVQIRHQPLGCRDEVVASPPGGWLPPPPVTVGITSGASTPDASLGAVIDRVLELQAIRGA
jgi:4-hydroxy-3-methylbut-2-enyl diphosphate reductase